MRADEWSRSRFWLSHFLYSRHLRPPVAWASPCAQMSSLAAAALPWLASLVHRTGLARAWVVRTAAEQYAADPAFVQCLRLVIREQQHHREMVSRLHARMDRTMPVAPITGQDMLKPLGVRFRLSLQLMSDLMDIAVLPRVAAAAEDSPMRAACSTILRERQMHVAFMAERLAHEFADFHFVRRNLRRWRIRAMFAGLLVARATEHRDLLSVLNLSPHAWASQTWGHFEVTLERIVPYRRDELLRLLTAQRERPYDRPN